LHESFYNTPHHIDHHYHSQHLWPALRIKLLDYLLRLHPGLLSAQLLLMRPLLNSLRLLQLFLRLHQLHTRLRALQRLLLRVLSSSLLQLCVINWVRSLRQRIFSDWQPHLRRLHSVALCELFGSLCLSDLLIRILQLRGHMPNLHK